ncbi:hypothetical protein K439DRAFT_1621470 [Ramaria rubella]|nr:hypothetical protein K439DRAFT_1621470 [Ramaria rubella]
MTIGSCTGCLKLHRLTGLFPWIALSPTVSSTGLPVDEVVKFLTYMDATVDDRSTRSRTGVSSMELHEHLCSCDHGAMSHRDSESTLKGREHALSCPRDTSCYHYNHMIVPDRVPLRFLSAASKLFTC